MRKLPVSVVMVVYNGGKTIERALRSVADLVDEIIVSHNGPCSDDSVEIARRYTDKVFVQSKHIPAPEPYRVFTYTKTSHDWMLQVDSDEYLSQEIRDHLGELISDPAVHGYEFLWPTSYKGKYVGVYYKTALVNKNFFYMIGSPSEYLKPINPQVTLKRLNYRLEHKPPYDNLTFQNFRKKWVPWARIQAEYYLREFASIPTYHYPHADWEFRTRVRIRHPILLGLFGTCLFNVALGVKDWVRTGQFLFLKSGMLMALQNAVLYTDVWKYQRRPWTLPVRGSKPGGVPVLRSEKESVGVAARSSLFGEWSDGHGGRN
ncbi:MAG: glycosyltransferase [bacterium]|nr:glycosyltransferase [bacterium]